MLVLENYPGVFCTEHIIFIVLSILLLTAGIVFLAKCKDEKKINILFKVLATILLITIIINRITVVDYNIKNKVGYSWLMLIPYSYCAFASFVMSLAILFGKKDNPIVHGLIMIGFCGGLMNIFYPTYLNSQMFWDVRTITGLIHHLILFFFTIAVIETGYVKISMKKFIYTPLMFLFIILLGMVQKYVLNFAEAMQIEEPLLKGVFITSWYIVDVAEIIVYFIFTLCVEHFYYKKKMKEIFTKSC